VDFGGRDFYSSSKAEGFKMRISDILQEKGAGVVTIDAGQTIHDAICKLNEHSIGALVVTGEGEEIAGIITERDILRKCGDHCARLSESPAQEETGCPSLIQDAMTKDLVIGVPDDDPNYAMGVMTKNRIRHLPILDDGSLTGIISIGDLVNVHLEEQVFENRTLKEYIHGRMRESGSPKG
jgi:CBS domain-containing protein